MVKKPEASQNLCLLMDSTSVLLARGMLMSPPDAPNMQIQIIDGRMEDVLAQDIFQVVLVQSKDPRGWAGSSTTGAI